MKKKELSVEVFVSRNGQAIPYDSLTDGEKIELGKRINRRAMRAVIRRHGYDVIFQD